MHTATKSRRPDASRAYAKALTKSRAAFRRSQQSARIAAWLAGQPSPHPDYYAAAVLRSELHLARLPTAALRWLGWHSLRHKYQGKTRTVWLPPGSRMRPYPIGRPRRYPPHLLPADFRPYVGKD